MEDSPSQVGRTLHPQELDAANGAFHPLTVGVVAFRAAATVTATGAG